MVGIAQGRFSLYLRSMVLCGRSGWAVHVPVLLSFVSAIVLFGSYLALVDEFDWGPIFGALLSLGFLAFTLSELRWIQVREPHLTVRSSREQASAVLDYLGGANGRASASRTGVGRASKSKAEVVRVETGPGPRISRRSGGISSHSFLRRLFQFLAASRF